MMPDVELDIDELVLHGFAPGDGDQIGAAIRRELARLFAEQGLPAGLGTGGAVPRLDGGGFQVAAGATTDIIGAQVAQAVYGGLAQAAHPAHTRS
jgi:hypothetical protein